MVVVNADSRSVTFARVGVVWGGIVTGREWGRAGRVMHRKSGDGVDVT